MVHKTIYDQLPSQMSACIYVIHNVLSYIQKFLGHSHSEMSYKQTSISQGLQIYYYLNVNCIMI